MPSANEPIQIPSVSLFVPFMRYTAINNALAKAWQAAVHDPFQSPCSACQLSEASPTQLLFPLMTDFSFSVVKKSIYAPPGKELERNGIDVSLKRHEINLGGFPVFLVRKSNAFSCAPNQQLRREQAHGPDRARSLRGIYLCHRRSGAARQRVLFQAVSKEKRKTGRAW